MPLLYNLEFYVYHLRPYGIVSGLQDLNRKPLPQDTRTDSLPRQHPQHQWRHQQQQQQDTSDVGAVIAPVCESMFGAYLSRERTAYVLKRSLFPTIVISVVLGFMVIGISLYMLGVCRKVTPLLSIMKLVMSDFVGYVSSRVITYLRRARACADMIIGDALGVWFFGTLVLIVDRYYMCFWYPFI